MDGQFLTFGVGLVCAGLLVLVAEVFVVSLGLLSAIGGGLILIGLILCFKAGIFWGISALIGTSIVLPFMLMGMLKFFRMEVLSRQGRSGADSDDESNKLSWLVGRMGKTLTQMSPAGKVDFEGHRIDAITEGLVLERGIEVRCRLVEGQRVVVVPALTPGPQKTFEALDFS
jgi:membrane-bound serine protease (ClpP class)